MKRIMTVSACFAVLFFLAAPIAFSQSEYVDDWIGTWTVTMLDESIVTWEITETWVSDTGKSHMALGIKYPDEVEFQIYFGKMFMQHYYIEVSHDKTVYDLPMDFSEYTELVPDDDFIRFTAEPGKYTIKSGYKGTVEPTPEPENCVVEYLLGADDPRLELLRQFRDEKMAASTSGQYLIKIYYDRSDDIIAVCEKNPAVKRSLKMIIESLSAVL